MISVIVPVYNAFPYLAQCITSILNQSYSDIELILVDDCSKDGSLSICRKFALQDARVKVYSNPQNMGQVQTYMKGISHADGEFISFVDSDDWIAPDMLRKLHTALVDHEADIAACGCWHVYKDCKIVEPSNIQRIGNRIFSHQDILESAKQVHVPNNSIDTIVKLYRCNKIFRRNILLHNLKYVQTDIRVFEDNNIVIPCILDAKKIVYINEPLYYYRRTGESTMSLFNDSIFNANLRFLKHLEFIYKDKHVFHDMKSDVYVVGSYSMSGVMKSDMPMRQKMIYLEMLNDCFKNYGVSLHDMKGFGMSSKLEFLYKLILSKHYFLSALIGQLYYQFKR